MPPTLAACSRRSLDRDGSAAPEAPTHAGSGSTGFESHRTHWTLRGRYRFAACL